MRSLAVALALAILATAIPTARSAAAAPDESSAPSAVSFLPSDAAPAPSSVLSPAELGLTEPAQGFFPYFVGLGFVGAPGLLGFGGCGPFSLGFCPFFAAAPFFSTFPAATLGFGGLALSPSLLGTGLLGFPFTGALLIDPPLRTR
ncbi:MAG TPA: hypothetical protein VFB73_18095 [Chloroflexota bacterium]|nr:hypothetical protein [Chloroflexota bacterium]